MGEVGDLCGELDLNRVNVAVQHAEASLDEGVGVEPHAAIEGLVQYFCGLHSLHGEGAKGLGRAAVADEVWAALMDPEEVRLDDAIRDAFFWGRVAEP